MSRRVQEKPGWPLVRNWDSMTIDWWHRAADRLMPRRALRREFQRQVAAMHAEDYEMDPEWAKIWALWGFRP